MRRRPGPLEFTAHTRHRNPDDGEPPAADTTLPQDTNGTTTAIIAKPLRVTIAPRHRSEGPIPRRGAPVRSRARCHEADAAWLEVGLRGGGAGAPGVRPEPDHRGRLRPRAIAFEGSERWTSSGGYPGTESKPPCAQTLPRILARSRTISDIGTRESHHDGLSRRHRQAFDHEL